MFYLLIFIFFSWSSVFRVENLLVLFEVFIAYYRDIGCYLADLVFLEASKTIRKLAGGLIPSFG